METPQEGYVLHTYGPPRYVKHAVASVHTLRRHDADRPVALFCPESHREVLEQNRLDSVFEEIEALPAEHQSIVGFKHHLGQFKPFDRSLFVDADMIWCRDPDPLWHQFAAFPFTATGLQNADHFFGGPKGLGVLVDVLLRRRQRTLCRFGLTHLPRVQAGMIYARDDATTREVVDRAADFLAQSDDTHFRSRLEEGRSEETCEWSLAMAMSELGLHVFPWLQGRNSPQLDYIDALVDHDSAFTEVTYRFYTSPFVYSLRGLPNARLRDTLLGLAEQMPRMGEYVEFTPYVLHFGWLHQKAPFEKFAERVWTRLIEEQRHPRRVETTSNTAGPVEE
ncbi:MAG: hypothetical protein BRD55_06870 [Bacteroidetes bacterium SW_9_63_38]|nr:MAG: hypothetical protein BRD55_06870 [Bacteroidetes bacterium SW_9_63_38]